MDFAPSPERLAFFLGGHDLEMVTIRELVAGSLARCYDHGLGWGARASAYHAEFDEAIRVGLVPVLVELEDDLGLAARTHAPVIVIDHHGLRAGRDQPTALEQVFALLGLTSVAWSRWFHLVAANDRGHIRGLLAAGATPDEITQVRAADRSAQGITTSEELAGRIAAAESEIVVNGRVTLVRLPHDRTATVTDLLSPVVGYTGPENLLILSPGQTNFFGRGTGIEALAAAFPGGYSGGELPDTGFWGYLGTLSLSNLLATLKRSLPVPTKSPDTIRVSIYRQILIWPLLLKEVAGSETLPPSPRQFDQFRSEFERAGWVEVCMLPDHVTPKHGSEITYEEMVYFHPPVRDFLYGDGSRELSGPLVRLRRSDVLGAELTFKATERPRKFSVPRLELYLCKPLVALLVVEIVTEAGLSLAEAMAVQSYFRQVYPPYFDEHGEPGNCPFELKWLTTHGPVVSNYQSGRQHFAEFVHQGAEPPVAHHWGWLLKDLKPYPGNVPHSTGLFYQQIEDDRIPGMTFLAVDKPDEIAEGDFDRLTFCDTSGSTAFPYAQKFLDDRRKDYLYDRFWEPTAGLLTRYLCSGYQFVLVVKEGENLTNTLLDHYRRPYFRMGLILHFHRAALLKFADDLAEAIKLLHGQHPNQEFANAEFRNRVTYIQMTFLKFRSRAWFTEVSNQLQGRELFAWWAKLLGTEAMFKHVDETSQRLYEALSEYETRQLTGVAAVGVPVTVGLTTATFVITIIGLIKELTSINIFESVVVAVLIGGLVGGGMWTALRGSDAFRSGGG
jgi:hypothetical protein